MADETLLPPPSELPPGVVRYRVGRPRPARRSCSAASEAGLSLEGMGHSVRIPPGAVPEEDGEVSFELSHTWQEGPEDQILMLVAHRIDAGGRRTGYRFRRAVTLRIRLPGNAGRGDGARSIHKYSWEEDGNGGGSWRFVREIDPGPAQGNVLQFEDDSFSGYAVAG